MKLPLLAKGVDGFRFKATVQRKHREKPNLRKFSAAVFTDAKLARSSSKNRASFPVAALRSAIATSAFSLLLAARYTLALCWRSALMVSFPIPVFPPAKIKQSV